MKALPLTVCLAAAVSLTAALVLADAPSRDATKLQRQLELFAKNNRAREIQDLIVEMTGSGEPKIAVLLPVAGTVLPSAANYKAAVEAIEKLSSDAAVEALIGILKKRGDYRQRVLILEAFGKRNDAASLAAIVEHLKANVTHVQVAAIRAARDRKERAPISALIDVLADHWKSRSRTWHECHLALVDLTGKDFDAIEDWKNYWSTAGASFDPKKVGEDKGPTRIAVKRTEDSVEFFGAEIFSRSLVFVIDVSGSMLMYDEPGEGRGEASAGDEGEKTGTTKVGGSSQRGGKGAGQGARPAGLSGNMEQDRQRLQRAKDQLSSALRKLTSATQFNIVTFSDKVQTWQKRLQPATPANIGAALKFVGDFQAFGSTYTDEALDAAFSDLAIDTIVLLSDGAPAHSRELNASVLIPQILEKVRDVNSSRKVTIHTFGFEGEGKWPAKLPRAGGQKPPPPPSPAEVKTFVEFLRSLASENGGEFRAIQ